MPIILVCILSLLAGSGVFIAGMNMMSGALERATGKGLKKLLEKIGNNPIVGVGIGAGITALIQSSAATSVMTIGLVNAGVMSLVQATSIIMGANIGTTVTGLLVSLSSLNISLFTSVLAFVGVMMTFFKNENVKNIGSILCGLGLIFIGLDLMSNAFANEEIKLTFTNIFASIDFPLLLILLGIVFTAIVQSSSAVTGLVIVMVGQGALKTGNALFIILGSNIGTCITAIIATIGTSTNAKRTGIIHLLFNIIGTVLFTSIIWPLQNEIVNLLNSLFGGNAEIQIAMFHLVFNVVTTIVLLPFIKLLVKLASLIVKDKKNNNAHLSLKYIDERLLRTPSIAITQVKKEVDYMASIAKTNLNASMNRLLNNEKIDLIAFKQNEEYINFMNTEITKFLIKLAPLMDGSNEKVVGAYFHVINDIERIGDHAENMVDIEEVLDKENVDFSATGKNDISIMFKKVEEMYTLALKIFDTYDINHLNSLNQIEETIDEMKTKYTSEHYTRLSMGDCKIELSSLFISTISNLERVADHLVNIGNSIISPTGDECNN